MSTCMNKSKQLLNFRNAFFTYNRMVSQPILNTVMTRIDVDKSTDHAKPNLMFFYHNIKDNEKKSVKIC